ncbi:MAG: MBOAT family protein [Nitrospirae bacterium]|nr:MBOAT family protein [Nitrospirota bacterium]
MQFNSLGFLVFFPMVVVFFFAAPHRLRWALLLGASYYFYAAWKPAYGLLVLLSTLIDYYAALRISRIENRRTRRLFLFFSLFSNLGMLAFFKYYNFFSHSLNSVLRLADSTVSLPEHNFLLPVGISFYTFQTLSYTFDVYRGTQRAEQHLGIFALYVSFFPQLVAGPIERAGRLLPQFRDRQRFDYTLATSGLSLMAWGFFKKLAIADRLGVVVNHVYANPADGNGPQFVLATFCFALQIYCDFSGYVDIGIGSARVLGFHLSPNFERPYAAESISDFWRRWHMSLSAWFRDYVYLPLGGRKVSFARWSLNVFVVFLASGLWHGASWTFVIWGGLHGLYMVGARVTQTYRTTWAERCGLSRHPGVHRRIRIGVTFVLVCFAWIFFRANTVPDALYIARNLTTGWLEVSSLAGIDRLVTQIGLGRRGLLVAVLVTGLMVYVQKLQSRFSVHVWFTQKPVWFRWASYDAIVLAILLWGNYDSNSFIYFQF